MKYLFVFMSITLMLFVLPARGYTLSINPVITVMPDDNISIAGTAENQTVYINENTMEKIVFGLPCYTLYGGRDFTYKHIKC